MINDKNFLKELKKKNPKSLVYISDKYSNLIFKVAYGILGKRNLSEECLNDVLLKIWENGYCYKKGEKEFFKWVMIIAKYSAIDLLRKDIKKPKVVELAGIKNNVESYIEEDLINKEIVNSIKKEIEFMSDKDKEIFIQKFYLDKQSKDIGNELGESEKYINLRIYRIRRKLKDKIFKEWI